jgi:hypothetical protein
MRLSLSFFILLVCALDFYYGQPGSGLHIAGLVAGILLAASVIFDRFLCGAHKPEVARDQEGGGDHLPSEPG